MKHLRSYLTLLTLLIVPSIAFAESDVRDVDGTAFAPNKTVVALGYLKHESSTVDLHQADTAVFRGLYLLHFGNIVITPIDLAIAVSDYTAYKTGAQVGMPALGPLSFAVRGSGVSDLTYLPSLSYVIPEGGVNHTILQFNPRFVFPTGQYDVARPINIGANRFTFTPYIGIGQRFASKFTLEAYGSMAIHGQNGSFGVPATATTTAGSTTMSQSPDIGVDVHFGYDMSRTFFVGASYYFLKDGSQTLGVAGSADVAQPTTSSLRFNFGIRIEKGTLLMLQFNQDVAASEGDVRGPKTRWFGARISHAFFDEPEPSTPTTAEPAPKPSEPVEEAAPAPKEREPEPAPASDSETQPDSE
jgi:hypothetical protein